MMLVVGGDLVELDLQGSNTSLAVNELEVAVLLIVDLRQINHSPTHSLVDASRKSERQARIVQSVGPRVLVKRPEYLSALAEHPAYAVEEDTLGISQMMQEKSNRPLASTVTSLELRAAQVKIL